MTSHPGSAEHTATFASLGLSKAVLQALTDVGYETPTPIQALTIPPLLQGKDVIGQAQTGTGKTAAFACPLIDRLDPKQKAPQVLVLTPTRELAIQVAEAFQRYAGHIKDFHVLPIYGGQPYDIQLRQLKRTVHVVVGTPGRVMDHMRQKTLSLSEIKTLILDEADEMLRMGFIDDVEWILEQIPATRQTALFSATMPPEIRKIARKHLRTPVEVASKGKTQTADNIRHRFWLVVRVHKLDALTRILEAESYDGILIFVRTILATLELAEKLQARGFAAAALNGDMHQKQRERTVEALREGRLDILVATDIAARGLDVKRISHVVNYDIPYDTDAYVHRVGRTGRAGSKGEAILFVEPREQRLLSSIERVTRQKIERMDLPSHEMVNSKRIAAFKKRITDTIASDDVSEYVELVEQFQAEQSVSALTIAAALARMANGRKGLLLKPSAEPASRAPERPERPRREVGSRPERPGRHRLDRDQQRALPQVPMERFRIEVGRAHKVRPGNIVGAIANESGLDSIYIGRIDIRNDHTLLDLPIGMDKQMFNFLKRVRILGQPMNISRVDAKGAPAFEHAHRKPGKPKPD